MGNGTDNSSNDEYNDAQSDEDGTPRPEIVSTTGEQWICFV